MNIHEHGPPWWWLNEGVTWNVHCSKTRLAMDWLVLRKRTETFSLWSSVLLLNASSKDFGEGGGRWGMKCINVWWLDTNATGVKSDKSKSFLKVKRRTVNGIQLLKAKCKCSHMSVVCYFPHCVQPPVDLDPQDMESDVASGVPYWTEWLSRQPTYLHLQP